MNDLVVQFQNTIIEMLQNERLTQEEFDILANLSEGMENDRTVLQLIKDLKIEDLKDRDIADCILAKHFDTALIIVSDEMIECEELKETAKQLFGG